MTDLERAVVKAAKEWAKVHAWDVGSGVKAEDMKLWSAVRDLERDEAQYEDELRTELAKFAKGEDPYPYRASS